MDPETLRRILHALKVDVHVSCPAVVRSIDRQAHTVEVQLLIRKVLPGEDPETDEDVLEDAPILTSVPIVGLSGGGYFVSFPLAAGSRGTVLFADRDIGAARATGAVSDPGTDETHGLSGAQFLPGFYTRAEGPRRSLPSGELVIGREVSGATLAISETHVDAGGVLALALAALVNLELLKISNTLASLAGATFGTPYVRSDVDCTITRGA